ncbi:MAG: class I SAM-dependent methyltransferase [Methanothrix sp.]
MTAVGTLNEANRVAWLEKTLLKIPAGSRILDAGAGEQQFKRFCSHLKYVSQDFAEYDGEGDRRGLQSKEWKYTGLDIVCDITQIPEPDESFDAIICTEVFEHLPAPILAIKEFHRLLRKGGRLIITAPFCSLTHFSPYHFYSGFNRYFYEACLEQFNFDIIEIEPNGSFFEYLAQEIRRIPFVSSKYSHDKPSVIDNLATQVILKMLSRFSEKDSGSCELLNFGYHVLAKKRSSP